MVEKIRKIRSFDFNITKVGNKFYGKVHFTAKVINIHYLTAPFALFFKASI